MTSGCPYLASHAAAWRAHSWASCRLSDQLQRIAAPCARLVPAQSCAPSPLRAVAAVRFSACTGSLEDIPDSEPMDAGTTAADIALSMPPSRGAGFPRKKKFQVRIRITPAQQVGLDEFWEAQARGSAHARQGQSHSLSACRA